MCVCVCVCVCMFVCVSLLQFFRVMGPVHPLGRVGEAEEVARLIVFFASDTASFITGTNMPIDGGLSVLSDFPN